MEKAVGSGLLDGPEEHMLLVMHPRMAPQGRLDVTDEVIPLCEGSGIVDGVEGDISCAR